MSKQTLEKMVRRELEALNDIIDEKIIKGLPYKAEARRHKFLLSKLYRVRVQAAGGSRQGSRQGGVFSWFTQPLSFF